MADVVADIRAEILSLAASTLGSSYQRLTYVFDIERNDVRLGRLGYGVRALGAVPAEASLNRVFTLDQGFELILTDTFAKDSTDLQKEEAVDTMFNKADDVMKQLVNTKINLPNTVLFVGPPTYSEPEQYRRAKMVALRVQFVVKYRTSLS